MHTELTGIVRVTDPDELTRKKILATILALVNKFPENNLTHLGGIEQDGEQPVLWFQRGFLHLRISIGAIEDKRHLGPYVEIEYDESKLDARSKYQKPLLEKALVYEEGLIVAPTGSGKTVVETMLVCRLKRRALILTHTTEIAKQIQATFKKLTGVDAGSIYGSVRDVRPVTVGLIQSVRSYDPILKEIGTLVIDEAHHISAPSYLAVLRACPAQYRYGLTATIKKTGDEEKIIYAAIGPVLGDITVGELQEQGFVNRGTVRPIYTGAIGTWFDFVGQRCWYYKKLQKDPGAKPCPAPCTFPANGEIDQCVMDKGYFAWVYKKLSTDEFRNKRLIQEIVQAAKDHPWIIVLTHLKNHANYISKTLADLAQGPMARLAMGPPMKKKLRDSMIADFKASGGVLVATSAVIGEGFDAPKTSCLVRAMPSGGRVAVRQQTGRVMRPQEKPSLVIDFVDIKIPRMKRMWMGRLSIYKSIGFQLEQKNHEPSLF